MKVAVFHGSSRKGNTYTATKIFMKAMSQCDEINYSEFFLPKDVPEFCLGCQMCLENPREKCPQAHYIVPIYQAVKEIIRLSIGKKTDILISVCLWKYRRNTV